MAKQYKFEIQVTRGWGGVEDIKIATGTDNEGELKSLVNYMATAMQDRADWHTEQLKKIEKARDEAMKKQDEQIKRLEKANSKKEK